jgi:hypothetical protein
MNPIAWCRSSSQVREDFHVRITSADTLAARKRLGIEWRSVAKYTYQVYRIMPSGRLEELALLLQKPGDTKTYARKDTCKIAGWGEHLADIVGEVEGRANNPAAAGSLTIHEAPRDGQYRELDAPKPLKALKPKV